MLARTLGPKFNTFPCYVQPKLNGVRALFQRALAPGRAQGVFQSRDEKLWNTNVLQHLHDEFSNLDILDLILDGELYVHGWRLQDINAAIAVNRKEPTEKTKDVQFHIFDVVDLSRPFSQRWFDLYTSLQRANLPHIRAAPTAVVHTREELDQHFHFYTSKGYEGIMLRPDGPYEFGEHMARHGQNMTTFRSKFLWKHKSWQDDEFECIGVTQGEGKADIGIGALICEPTYDIATFCEDQSRAHRRFKVGTGLTDEDRVEFAKNPPIGKLVKVRYLCLTTDGIPFNPSFICVM